MRKTRRLAVLAAAGALAVATAGYGNSDNNESNSSSVQSLARQNVEVIAEWSGAEQAAFQAVLDGFSKKTGANVTYTSGGDNTSAGRRAPGAAGRRQATRRQEPGLPAYR